MSRIKPKSFYLEWSITERCNLDCKHCFREPEPVEEEMDEELLKNILKRYLDQIEFWGLDNRNARVAFTGGEPFIKKGLFPLLEECYKNKDKLSYDVFTNGTKLNEKKVEKLRRLEVDHVQVSLEGSKKVNDRIRGKGVYDKAVRAVKLLRKKNISVDLSMVVSKINLSEVPRMVSLSKRLGTGLAIRRYVPLGGGRRMKEKILAPKEVRNLWHYALEVKPKVECEDGILTQDFPEYDPGGCAAGYAGFSLLPNGDVYPCRRLPVCCGNLIRDSFEEVYYSEQMASLRNLNNINDLCFECPHFDKCRGGAKCMSYAYFGSISAPDPHCWRLFDSLPNSDLSFSASSHSREKRLNDDLFVVEEKNNQVS